MTKQLGLWVMAMAAVIILLPAAVGLLVRAIPSGFQPSSDGVVKIFGNQTISQEVRPAANFAGVAVSLKNPNLVNKNDLLIQVKQGDQLEREVKLNGAGIADGNFVKINFGPIDNLAGQSYLVVFSAPSSTDGDALGLVTTDHKSTELGQMSIASQSATQGVALITLSRPRNPVGIVGFIYQSTLSRLVGDPIFGLIYVGLIVILVIGLIKLTGRNSGHV